MSKRCQATKSDGTPCRAYPLRGTDYCHKHHPDRQLCAQPGCTNPVISGLSHCQIHRQDGGTRAGFAPGHKTSRFKHTKSGFYTQPLTHDKLVDTIIRIEMLATYADRVTDYDEYLKTAKQLRRLYFRLHRELEKTDLNAQEIEQLIASGKAKALEQLKAELAEHASLTRPETLIRSPLYHQILDYIKNFFKCNGQSPLLKEIADGLSISQGAVQYYVNQLVKDKKLHKVPGNRRHGRFLRLGPPPGE